MKTLLESIIGRRGSSIRSKSKDLKSFGDLEYGDIVIIQKRMVPDRGGKYFIYLPKEICYLLFNNLREDVFVTCNLNDKLVPLSYWKADGFNNYGFPFFEKGAAEIVSYEGHVQEYNSIKTREDVKRIFDKYNLPIS